MDLSGGVNPDTRRHLPSVDKLCREVVRSCPELSEWAVLAASRLILRSAREEIESMLSRGADASELKQIAETQWAVRVAAEAARVMSPHPRPVINGTGVVLHTNLGRSPLARGAAEAAAEASVGYSDLELDLETGRRGNRLAEISAKICLLSGAEAATVVNNNAAAVLLALNTLASGREVVVSRGELVEIGGSFRVPAIMERAGVRLVEVGTTNRTHARDYEQAIGPDTALLLKVHRSNFEQRGYVAEVDLEALVEIGHSHGLPVVEDLGAGTLVDLTDRGLPRDAYAPARVRLGVDLVCFSGDKLIGGPQAGIILGNESTIAALRKNPLARALRVDKMTIAALDWTLNAMLEGRAEQDIPILKMMFESSEQIETRAGRLIDRIKSIATDQIQFAVVKDRVLVGGGSLPGLEFESWVVTIRSSQQGLSTDRIVRRMREAETPVLARVREGAVCIDLRTLAEEDLEAVASAIKFAVR
ncbi:MAG: L-seryl-tRNA(Sec) selenium transferase [Myxococcales bacterium]|nr:L-seryl-tRNA(Sec) selenium transferase [Myxococcales bacterium]